jgi:hypothetical protein
MGGAILMGVERARWFWDGLEFGFGQGEVQVCGRGCVGLRWVWGDWLTG